MNRIVMLLVPAVLLAAAGSLAPTSGPRAPETTDGQSALHMNRHIDAHVPARQGEATSAGQEPARRRPAQVQPPAPAPPSLMQPPRNRLY